MKISTELSDKTYTSNGRALAAARCYHKSLGGRMYGGVHFTMDDVEIIQNANGWRWHFIVEFDESTIRCEEALKSYRKIAIA